MSKLILVRHAQSLGNRDRIFTTTPQELALTDLGYAQARAAASRIAELFRPNLVVTSPFVRASETARVIAEALGVQLQIEPNLYERELGAYRGRSYDSLLDAAGYDALRPWIYQPQGGESYEDVQARVAPVLDRLAREHSSEDIVVVSHGGVMMTLWAYVTGQWEAAHAPPNCGIVLIEYGPGGYSAPQIIDDANSINDAGG
jgi:broad specificity phosphatase PhoE